MKLINVPFCQSQDLKGSAVVNQGKANNIENIK